MSSDLRTIDFFTDNFYASFKYDCISNIYFTEVINFLSGYSYECRCIYFCPTLRAVITQNNFVTKQVEINNSYFVKYSSQSVLTSLF